MNLILKAANDFVSVDGKPVFKSWLDMVNALMVPVLGAIILYPAFIVVCMYCE